jgi:hypothetical protein
MAYSDAARARRKCTGTTKAGDPCQAWAAGMTLDSSARCMPGVLIVGRGLLDGSRATGRIMSLATALPTTGRTGRAVNSATGRTRRVTGV